MRSHDVGGVRRALEEAFILRVRVIVIVVIVIVIVVVIIVVIVIVIDMIIVMATGRGRGAEPGRDGARQGGPAGVGAMTHIGNSLQALL